MLMLKALATALLVLMFLGSLFPVAWADWPMFHHDLAHTGAIGHLPTVPTQNWNFSTGGDAVGYSSPAVVDGVVYVGSGGVYALDAATGKEIWQNPSSLVVTSSPAFVDGVVYVGGNNGVYALNATTGDQIWYFPTGVIHLSSPAVVNGIVYIGSWDGNIYALNASIGGKIWSFDTYFRVESSPAVAEGVVYVLRSRSFTL
jgi:outer membrane protein assembly factor BamB